MITEEETTSDVPTTPPPYGGVNSLATFARCRLAAIRKAPAARREVALVVGMMVLLYAVPFATWWRRWTLPNSAQGYGVFVFPIILAWMWVARYRLVMPELDSLQEEFVDTSVIKFLMEEPPRKIKRTFWLLWLGGLLSVSTIWMGDPTFTGIAFFVTTLGIIGYRHGTFALRVAAFPLCLLLTIIPMPGVIVDIVIWRLQSILMAVVANILHLLGAGGERISEGNMYWIPTPVVGAPSYQLWAGQNGNGFAEAGLFLIGAMWFLSIVQAQFRRKLLCMIFGTLWIGVLISLRLVALAFIGAHDPAMEIALRPVTSIMVVLVGAGGQFIIMSVLGCTELQPWVRFRRDRAARPDDYTRVPMHGTLPAIQRRLLRNMTIVTTLGLAAIVITRVQAANYRFPPLPHKIDAWTEADAVVSDTNAERDYPPAVYKKYMAAEKPTVFVSVARAHTMNDFRAPYKYLAGVDGTGGGGNMETLVPRAGEKLPVHALMVMADRGDIYIVIHWTETPGGEANPEPWDLPGTIFGSMLQHAPDYVCDVWLNAEGGANAQNVAIRFADEIDKRIRTLKR